MRLLCFVGAPLVVTAGVVAAVAYRRAEHAGCSFGACLRQMASEWTPAAVRRRARLAIIDGARAMAVRERVAWQQMSAVGVAAD